MKLVRNHIIYAKHQIENELDEKEYPKEYYDELPPEISQDYMARSDDLRKNARSTYHQYLQDDNYQKLLGLEFRISLSQRREVCYDAVIGYVQGLKKAIEEDDLVMMRRHEKPERYLESFANCIEKIEQLKSDKGEVEQITFHLDL